MPEARAIARHGYGILLYDSRASGESEGDVSTWGDREQRDVFAALDFATGRPEVDPARIAVLGFSIGGSTASLAAAKDQRARAVILYATWTSLEDEIHTNQSRLGAVSWWPVLFMFRRAGVAAENVRPIDHIREIAPRPLLMIAGGADEDTPVPVMQKMFDAAGEPKQLLIVPRAWHGGVFEVGPQEYEKQVVAFLDQALAPPRRK